MQDYNYYTHLMAFFSRIPGMLDFNEARDDGWQSKK